MAASLSERINPEELEELAQVSRQVMTDFEDLIKEEDRARLFTSLIHWLEDPAGSMPVMEEAARLLSQLSVEDQDNAFVNFELIARKARNKCPPRLREAAVSVLLLFAYRLGKLRAAVHEA